MTPASAGRLGENVVSCVVSARAEGVFSVLPEHRSELMGAGFLILEVGPDPTFNLTVTGSIPVGPTIGSPNEEALVSPASGAPSELA